MSQIADRGKGVDRGQEEGECELRKCVTAAGAPDRRVLIEDLTTLLRVLPERRCRDDGLSVTQGFAMTVESNSLC